MPIYMEYEGIKGEVSAKAFKDWIEVNSFQWGVGRGISAPVGKTSDRESSAPSVSEIVVTKSQDVTSIELLKEALCGEGKKVSIAFVKTDAKELEKYALYKLEEVMISGFSMSSGGDRPMESISLNFTKIDVEQIPMKSKGETGSSKHVLYNLAEATVG